MPLLDIAAAQPAFQNHLGTLRSQTLLHGKLFSTSFTIGNENRFASSWKSLDIHKRVHFSEMPTARLLIKAVATLEPKSFVQNEREYKGNTNSQLGIDSSSRPIELQSSSENSEEVNERERLRRMRISKANKGNTPWNKGRKHSPETLQRIKERTRLAMQNPKVKMKLINLGHAQSDETKLKIGVGVRMGWQRRREKLILQERCCFEWQNLVAEASRRGYVGEDELQWDSYVISKEQLDQEWAESVEERKKMPRLKGSKRAPKSPEQRRKISEAISAKWANPDYRKRVCSGLAKYHGIPEQAERKPRRRPSGSTQSTRRSPIKEKAIKDDSSKSETTSQNQRSRFRRSNAPLYKDPLASSKLEMIKNIRAQRAAAETKKTEAIERARLLIAEAEKAAKALEVAATKSPIAQASLMETRKLIAEAIQSIESIEPGQITSHENDGYPSVVSTELLSQIQKDDMGAGIEGLTNQADQREVNGTKTIARSDSEDFDFGKFTLQELLNGEEELLPTSSSGYGLLPLNLQGLTKQPDQLEPNGNIECGKNPLPNGANVQYMKEETPSKSVTKKWVCGRLIEVAE